MLNHSFFNALRTSAFRGQQIALQLSADSAARKFAYENVKVRKLKYKSAAKERRKAVIRLR